MWRAAGLVLLLLGFGAPASAQTPEFALTYMPDLAYRPLVRMGTALDRAELADAARSGVPIRVRVRVELWRDGWTDDLVASELWSAVIAFDPLAQQFLVRGRSADVPVRRFASYAAARGAIEGDYPLQIRPTRAGRYYYLGTLQVETLSLSDIEELERWLQGELQPAVSGERSVGGALGAGAKRLMIRLLNLPARSLEARTDRFRVP
ncbi:MAG: DUF4390 domain-containing protein [Longimicrobiales bacterium]